jgi:lysophospholipase L1-like esterase
MIGGSTVRIGTRFEVTLPGALKRVLQAQYPESDIEVLNGGIISAISRQELIFLTTTLVDYDLDILIIYDGINDSGQMLYYERRPNFPYNYRMIEEAWTQYVTGRRSPLWRQILSRSAILKSIWPENFGDTNILDRVTATELIEEPALRQAYTAAHRHNWEKIRRVCAAYSIRPFFVLQPTSLYALFPDGIKKQNQSTPLHDKLYANYVIYEELRQTTRKFSEMQPELGVLDLSSFLPAEAFFDGAHVYDDVNDLIARKLADFIVDDINIMQQQIKQGFR